MTRARPHTSVYVHNRLAEIGTRMQLSVQTLVSFYLLNKLLRCVGIILLVEFSKYLESFSMIWSGIRYIWHKQFGLLFIESSCIFWHTWHVVYMCAHLFSLSTSVYLYFHLSASCWSKCAKAWGKHYLTCCRWAANCKWAYDLFLVLQYEYIFELQCGLIWALSVLLNTNGQIKYSFIV